MVLPNRNVITIIFIVKNNIEYMFIYYIKLREIVLNPYINGHYAAVSRHIKGSTLSKRKMIFV